SCVQKRARSDTSTQMAGWASVAIDKRREDMSDGRKAEKPEVKQEETSSSSIWMEIARDVARTTVLGAAGFGVSKAITAGLDAAQAKAGEDKAEQAANLVLETAFPLVGMALGAAAARGATKGAECALK